MLRSLRTAGLQQTGQQRDVFRVPFGLLLQGGLHPGESLSGNGTEPSTVCSGETLPENGMSFYLQNTIRFIID